MNLQEAKALFFAQYLGQKVLIYKYCEKPKLLALYDLAPQKPEINDQDYLLLRSVDQLYDEDMINISILSDEGSADELHRIEHLANGKYIIGELKKGESYPFVIYQFILRIGILLHFTYLNEENKPITLRPDEIIKLGWAKY